MKITLEHSEPLDETHLDDVRGLILLRGFHFQYLTVGWQLEEDPAVKTASNINRFMLHQSKDMLNTQKPGQGDRPANCTRNRKWLYGKLQIATLNVSTMKGQSAEIVEMLSRRIFDICCAQEIRWKGEWAQKIMEKNCHYKFFWKGYKLGHGGIGIQIKEKWSESVLSISRVNLRIMMLRMLIEITLVNVTYLYAPQVGLSNHDKDAFYEQLLTCISSIEDYEIHIIAGGFNGHAGKESVTFDNYDGGKGYGTRNTEGLRILDLCNATDLAVWKLRDPTIR